MMDQIWKDSHKTGSFEIVCGDSLQRLKDVPSNSISSVCCDPPYGLGNEPDALAMLKDWIETGHHEVKGRGFMNELWDSFVPQPEIWKECLRVLKPGGHLVSFAGTRTMDLVALGLRIAGFELRDSIGYAHEESNGAPLLAWNYFQGFPKGTNIEKAINKMENVELNEIPSSGAGLMNPEVKGGHVIQHQLVQKGESTENAKRWSGWSTTLKPSFEPIILARKPVSEKTIVNNVLKWGTGAINIGACRIGDDVRYNSTSGSKSGSVYKLGIPDRPNDSPPIEVSGRWPGNIVHDGSEEVVKLFPETKSCASKKEIPAYESDGVTDFMAGISGPNNQYNDSGSAARFFKQVKMEDNEWLAKNLNLLDALIVGENLSLKRGLEFIVQKVAAISVLPLGTVLSVVSEHSMNVTAKELKILAETIIETMMSLGPKFLQEWKQESIFLTQNHAKISAIRKPTGIMKITINLSKSDGYAEPVILNITPKNLEVGESDYRIKYCAKASKNDREEGIPDEVEETVSGVGALRDAGRESLPRKNIHPCVKPTELMRWLCRLVTPIDGTILDPFMGSGSTGKAAILEGFNFVGIEMNEEYFKIAGHRINAVKPKEEPVVIPEVAIEKEIQITSENTEQMTLAFDSETIVQNAQ